jgi:hypothetical protein
MDELKVELQQIYTYVRSRDFNSVFLQLGLSDFIDRAKAEINTDGIRPSKLTKLNQLDAKLSAIIERAKKVDNT